MRLSLWRPGPLGSPARSISIVRWSLPRCSLLYCAALRHPLVRGVFGAQCVRRMPGEKKDDELPKKDELAPPLPASAVIEVTAGAAGNAGRIEARSSCVLDFVITADTSGKQTHQIIVRNLTSQMDHLVSISFTAKAPQYLQFVDIADRTFDFGDCYYDDKRLYVDVKDLRVQNVCEQPLSISLKSNLANQVFIFQDDARTTPAKYVAARPVTDVCIMRFATFSLMDVDPALFGAAM
jgi:hypothetical protein